LLCLTKKQYKNLLVIHEVYRQQKIMYEGHLRRMDDRIVSISQPHIRPIKRGKAGRPTEFGAKISVSLVDGVAFVDHLSWDNFNEGGDLPAQAEAYRRRFGSWPKSIHADKLYRNRDNLKFCKKYGIRLSGPPLGRPPKVTAENAMLIQQQKEIARKDEVDRIPIEGKFGQGKRRFGIHDICFEFGNGIGAGLFFNRNARIIAYMLARTGQLVEKGCFAGVWISGQRDGGIPL